MVPEYDRITIVAHSFGVVVATEYLANCDIGIVNNTIPINIKGGIRKTRLLKRFIGFNLGAGANLSFNENVIFFGEMNGIFNLYENLCTNMIKYACSR